MTVRPVHPAQRKSNRGRPPLTDAQRQRILNATAAVFLRRGYQGASTTEIARRAHTSKETLYSLFPTKADLFIAVMSEHTGKLFALHVEYIASADLPQKALMDMGCRMLRMFSTPEFVALYRISVAEMHKFPDLARQLWRECAASGHALLVEYLRSRRLGGPDYSAAAWQFISLVLGDFVLNLMLNPDIKLTERTLHMRVRHAVRDFLVLHPAPMRQKPAAEKRAERGKKN